MLKRQNGCSVLTEHLDWERAEGRFYAFTFDFFQEEVPRFQNEREGRATACAAFRGRLLQADEGAAS